MGGVVGRHAPLGSCRVPLLQMRLVIGVSMLLTLSALAAMHRWVYVAQQRPDAAVPAFTMSHADLLGA